MKHKYTMQHICSESSVNYNRDIFKMTGEFKSLLKKDRFQSENFIFTFCYGESNNHFKWSNSLISTGFHAYVQLHTARFAYLNLKIAKVKIDLFLELKEKNCFDNFIRHWHISTFFAHCTGAVLSIEKLKLYKAGPLEWISRF